MWFRVQVCSSVSAYECQCVLVRARSSVSGFECLLTRVRVYVHISMCVCECICADVHECSMKCNESLF